MPNASYLAAAIIGAFIIYLAMNDRLKIYAAMMGF